jgi:hypothetical protein
MENTKINNTWFKSFKNSNGNVDSFSWSLGDSIALGGTQIVIAFIVATICSFILPLFVLLIGPICTPKERRGYYITSILVTLYTLADYHFGWLGHAGWSNYLAVYQMIIATNIAMLIITTLLLFFEKHFFKMLRELGSPVLMWYLILPSVGYFLVLICRKLLNSIITMHPIG